MKTKQTWFAHFSVVKPQTNIPVRLSWGWKSVESTKCLPLEDDFYLFPH